MHVRVERRVFSDIEEAMSYYVTEAGSKLARDFYDEFKRCKRLISERPASFPVVVHDIRRINFHRFPYHILYCLVEKESAVILVVKHDHRDSDFGLDR